LCVGGKNIASVALRYPQTCKYWWCYMNTFASEDRNFLIYYDLEKYLFENVRASFLTQGKLNAFDFFCIIIWKANRAKSTTAKRLLKKTGKSLELTVSDITSQLHLANSPYEKLKVLISDYGFLLPMASAILTVLYPDEFSIYDTRVCGILNAHHKLANVTKFESIWSGYQDYITAVKAATSDGLTLRDKDRSLWGKSFADQLEADVLTGFTKIET
jgi:hypothetical protein